jgi:hypothetical protein
LEYLHDHFLETYWDWKELHLSDTREADFWETAFIPETLLSCT